MKYFSCIIIDDERQVREALEQLLSSYCPSVRVSGTAASADEGRALLKLHTVDIIFLDIRMPKEDGFAFLRTIPADTYGIIFTTAFEEYALKALKANAIDYLLKPIDPLELKEAVDKAIHYREMRQTRSEVLRIYRESLDNLPAHIHQISPIDRITVAEQYGFRMVKLAEIMYLQADSNYTIIHLSGLSKIVATRTLAEFEKLLDQPPFFRIHKSTIINMNFIRGYSSYEGNFAELTDGTRLTISRRKLTEFREAVKQLTKSLD
ncbi:MAG TPA: LytTR family DNA-binding domain-containing protein [Bacteroidales bacterium]|nr:LytTR family DNA-binding domain-containing protein [Bacteroidales bacterium]